MTAARILVVDDDADTLELVSYALGARGFAVTGARNAGEALDALRAGGFDLVITDYDMPGQTGAELLARAGREGVLGDASTLVVTAHPDPAGVPEDTPLLRKPIDLERLVVQIRTILHVPPEAPAAPPDRTSATPGRPALDLVLYVSPRSPASARARRRLEEVLTEFDSAAVTFEVCDLFRNVASAEDDRVVFTPTLVKRRPLPRAWILGDLATPDVVRDLLAMYGVPRRAGG
jgi:CheY-like chemotaxis protein